MESSGASKDDVATDSSSPSVNPSVFILSDAIKQVMASFAEAHQQTMAAVATIVASGNWLLFPSQLLCWEVGCLPNDDAISLIASDTGLALNQTPRWEVATSEPSTVTSSLQQLNKLYHNEEKVGLPLGAYMAESLNVMGKHHMEKSFLEDLMGKQICPANIDLQLKQVNEEIYSCQGGGGGGGEMSNAWEGWLLKKGKQHPPEAYDSLNVCGR